MSHYPWDLTIKLASNIENCRIESAHKFLDASLSNISGRPKINLAVKKLLCAQLITNCLRGAHAGGASSGIILREHQEMLGKIESIKRWKDIKQTMHEYIDILISHIRPNHTTNIERFVRWMRKDMKNNLENPKTLSQYAQIADFSTRHLSKSFIEQTGQTFTQEIRQIRIKQAKTLLTNTSFKISLVAHRIGLRDTSQFIQLFRLEMGATPGKYRAKRLKSY